MTNAERPQRLSRDHPVARPPVHERVAALGVEAVQEHARRRHAVESNAPGVVSRTGSGNAAVPRSSYFRPRNPIGGGRIDRREGPAGQGSGRVPEVDQRAVVERHRVMHLATVQVLSNRSEIDDRREQRRTVPVESVERTHRIGRRGEAPPCGSTRPSRGRTSGMAGPWWARIRPSGSTRCDRPTRPTPAPRGRGWQRCRPRSSTPPCSPRPSPPRWRGVRRCCGRGSRGSSHRRPAARTAAPRGPRATSLALRDRPLGRTGAAIQRCRSNSETGAGRRRRSRCHRRSAPRAPRLSRCWRLRPSPKPVAIEVGVPRETGRVVVVIRRVVVVIYRGLTRRE